MIWLLFHFEVLEVFIVLGEMTKYTKRVIVATVVHHDNFKFRIVLLKQHRNKFTKVVLLIVGAHYYRNWLWFSLPDLALFGKSDQIKNQVAYLNN